MINVQYRIVEDEIQELENNEYIKEAFNIKKENSDSKELINESAKSVDKYIIHLYRR
jgi:hypothetical protein